MVKKLGSKKPLIITKVQFLPVADDVSKRKIQQVIELLLHKSGKGETRFEEHIPPNVNNTNGGSSR